VWVEFYSTPFVFLTDTFTGEFLCGRDVGGGHKPLDNLAPSFPLMKHQYLPTYVQ
jgi:hypothetical protein